MAERETMNVSVTSEQKAFVKAEVESGRYQTDSEVVRAGLRLLQREESRRKLEKLLVEGLEGEPVQADERFFTELRESVRERLDRSGRRAKRA